MDEYIDKNALVKSFDEKIKSVEIWRDDCKDLGTTTEYADRAFVDFNEARLRVKNFPTVDAVEVIRCKDCKHKSGSACDWFAYLWVKENDFCSRAERKEDG